jgi:hypothetical protein
MIFFAIITIIVGLISYGSYSYLNSSEDKTNSEETNTNNTTPCPTGTSLLNTGGLSNITGCKCPLGQKYYNKKCVAEICPTGTALNGLGGVASGYPGCFCPELQIYSNKSCISCPVDKPFNTFIKACVSCYSTSSVYNTGVPAGPTGCFCPLGMQYVNSACTPCTTVVSNSSFSNGLTDWSYGNVGYITVSKDTIKPGYDQNNYITMNNDWKVGGLSVSGYISQRLINFITGKKYVILIRCSSVPDHWQPMLNVKIDNPDNSNLSNVTFDYSFFTEIATNGSDTASKVASIIFTPKEKTQNITIKNTGAGDAFRHVAVFSVHIAPINLTTNNCGYPIILNSSFQSPAISMDLKLVTTDLIGWSVFGKTEIIKTTLIPGLSQVLCLYGDSHITQEVNYFEIGKKYIIYACLKKKPNANNGYFLIGNNVTLLFSNTIQNENFSTISTYYSFTAEKTKYNITFRNDSRDITSAVMLAYVAIVML